MVTPPIDGNVQIQRKSFFQIFVFCTALFSDGVDASAASIYLTNTQREKNTALDWALAQRASTKTHIKSVENNFF